MKKIKLIYFIISTFSLLIIDPVIAKATEKSNSIFSKTIAYEFLEIESKFGTTNANYEQINKLLTKCAERLTVKTEYSTDDAVEILKKIHILLIEEGYHFKQNYLINTGLTQKNIDCDTYAALYISIAEITKLPLIPVYAPNHCFIRFLFHDGTNLNWEPTEGKSYSDEFYINKLKISRISIQKGVYLKNLTRKQFSALEYNNIGAFLIKNKKYNESIPFFDMALYLYPVYSSAYHNRGCSYYALKKSDKALSDLIRAASLDPARSTTQNSLGDIYFDTKKFDKALDHYEISIKLDPDYFPPYYSIGLLMKLAGNEEESRKWIKKSEELKNKK